MEKKLHLDHNVVWYHCNCSATATRLSENTNLVENLSRKRFTVTHFI